MADSGMRMQMRMQMSVNRRTGMVDASARIWRVSVRLLRRVPVDRPMITFVRKTEYSLRLIVHPGGGGNAMQVVCAGCGAAYTFRWDMPPAGCANCAVMKESGVVVRCGGREWEWLWSEHGYGIRVTGGAWSMDVFGNRPKRFHSKSAANREAARMERDAWALVEACGDEYPVQVEPYPYPYPYPYPSDPADPARG